LIYKMSVAWKTPCPRLPVGAGMNYAHASMQFLP
jgi:hypothetical protein